MNKHQLNYTCNKSNLTVFLNSRASGKDLISEGYSLDDTWLTRATTFDRPINNFEN